MNTIVSLSIIAVIPIVFSGILYLMFSSKQAQNTPYMVKQIIAGIIFGLIAICGTEFGVNIDGAIINARDAAPLCAGLIFGGPAGIIAGLIGGIERWFAVLWGAGTYTRLACTISTILAGIIAALLRKYVFDNDIPIFDQALITGIVVEVIHMLMIFITNLSDVRRAFRFVEACTIPMVSINALAVALAVIFVTFIKNKRNPSDTKKASSISNMMQRRLIFIVLLGFIITSLFGYILQDQISTEDTHDVLKQAIVDAVDDVEDRCDETLLHINHLVVDALENNPNADLVELSDNYNVYEIDVINRKGIITASSKLDNIGFDMSSGEQSKEFMKLIEDPNLKELVQPYMPTASRPDFYLKYSGVKTNSGFVQVAFNNEQMTQEIESELSNIATNRHIGENGELLVLDGTNIISYTKDSKLNPDNIKNANIVLDPNNTEEYTVYETTINDTNYYYMFTNAEKYSVVGIIPQSEANFSKELSTYLNSFMQIIVFGTLVSVIYFITKRLIVDNIRNVNKSLKQITDGNLETVVDVKSSREFVSLSDGINTTVDALKKYIEEAKTRIDKELQYAKEIQSSALPSTFPAFPSRKEFDIYALMTPAKEIGGDFYDFYFVGKNKLAFVVADVSGKGIPASLFMMRAKTILKTYAEHDIQVADIFTNANYNLCEGNDAGMFVTAWMGILNLETGELKYANAGHNAPMLRRKNGKFEFLKGPAGFILAGMEEVSYKEQSITLEPGDEILLYTDGVVEATNANEELYGNDRLATCINNHLDEDAKTLCQNIEDDVFLFYDGAPQFDDLTELCLQFKDYSSIDK